MKLLNILALVVCLAVCLKAQEGIPEDTLKFLTYQCYLAHGLHHEENHMGYENKRTENGYEYRHYRSNPHNLADYTDHKEEGIIMSPGTDNEELVVKGKYNYQDGFTGVYVMYTADKNGYRPYVFVRRYTCLISPSVALLKNLAG